MASLLVADEALSVLNVFCPFCQRKVDLVYVHSIRIWLRGSAHQQDVAVSSSLELSESYHISVEFPCFIKPQFPLPTSLPIGEGGGGHHDGELLGNSSLEGIY